MADLLLDPLPTAWEGRAIDWDFRPMVWLSNQYLRKKPEQDPAGFLVEAFRRFYREPVPAAQVEDAFAAMLRFYAGGTPDRETRSSGGSGSGEVTFDYAYDADYIVAAFQQAYCIDLTAERLHWWRFRALFLGLPEETTMRKILDIRATDTSGMEGRMRQEYEQRKEVFALPNTLKGGTRIVSVQDHNAAFLARFQHRKA